MAAIGTVLETVIGGNHAAYGNWIWKTQPLSSAPSQNDTIPFFYVPAKHFFVFGVMYTDDLDTGTEALEIDIGWTANGGAATYDINGTTYTNDGASASANGLVNSAVLSGDAITDLIPAAGVNNLRFMMPAGGPRFFGEKTLIQGVVTAAAGTFGAGNVTVLGLVSKVIT